MAKRAKAGAIAQTVGLVEGETTGPARPSKSRRGDTFRAFRSDHYAAATRPLWRAGVPPALSSRTTQEASLATAGAKPARQKAART
jgi:hypothetical protein